MNCEEFRDSLSVLLDGDDAALADHARECSACAERLSQARRVHERLLAHGAGLRIADGVMLRTADRKPEEHRKTAGRMVRWVLPMAAAAGFGVAAFMLVSSPREAGAAPLAAMVQKVRTSAAVAFTISESLDGWIAQSARFTVVNDQVQRAEFQDGRVIITDLTQGRVLVLLPEFRWAIPTPARHGAWNPYPTLVALAELPGELIAHEAVNGEPALVVRAPAPPELGDDGVLTIWISVATGLPLRIEAEHPLRHNEDGSLRTVVFSDFEFGGEHDAGLFSLTPPEGYEVRPPIDDPVVARKDAMVNARNVFMGAMTYHQQHGSWPASIAAMIDGGILTGEQASNPRLPERAIGYEFYPPRATDTYDAHEAVILEPLEAWPGGTCVGFADGHVDWVDDEATYRRLLREARERGN